MKDLLVAVQAVVDGLIGASVFDDPAGGTHVMRYYLGEMPDKRDTGNAQDFPFCLISAGNIELSRVGRTVEAVITFGLYEAGSKTDALTMIDSVLTLMDGLSLAKYAGYRLIGDFSGNYTGEYPNYELSLSGDFKKVK